MRNELQTRMFLYYFIVNHIGVFTYRANGILPVTSSDDSGDCCPESFEDAEKSWGFLEQ